MEYHRRLERTERCYNGDWILMDYEPKSKALNHVFDKHTQANGAKEFKLEVTDDRGNIARFELAFTR
jgi:hypothetical protein